jgi:hypothetical protein
MGSISEGERNKMLNAWAGRAAYAANPAVYVKLHTGDPGSAGANNAAANTTRQQATFGVNAATGAISNTAEILWTGVSTTETYTHASLWTDPTAGTFIGSDDLSAATPVTAGDNFRIPIGDLDVAVT